MRYQLSRMLYYWKRYGFCRMVKKIFCRILKLDKKDDISEQERYERWMEENEPDVHELEKQKKYRFDNNPKISVVVPMFNTKEKFFVDLINSLFGQTYDNWEVCFADRKCSAE